MVFKELVELSNVDGFVAEVLEIGNFLVLGPAHCVLVKQELENFGVLLDKYFRSISVSLLLLLQIKESYLMLL